MKYKVDKRCGTVIIVDHLKNKVYNMKTQDFKGYQKIFISELKRWL